MRDNSVWVKQFDAMVSYGVVITVSQQEYVKKCLKLAFLEGQKEGLREGLKIMENTKEVK